MVLGSLDTWKTISDLAANLVTVLAFVIGVVAAYWAFVRERALWPRAGLKLLITHRVLTPDLVLLHVKVLVENLGSLRIRAQYVRVDVSQVLPVDGKVEPNLLPAASKPEGEKLTEVEWPPLLGASETREAGGKGQPKVPEIEPGETDEFCFDLLVPRGLETVHVYAYLKNVKRRRRDFGWEATEFYDVGDPVHKAIRFGMSPATEPLRDRSTSGAPGPIDPEEPRTRGQKEERPKPVDDPLGPGDPDPKEQA